MYCTWCSATIIFDNKVAPHLVYNSKEIGSKHQVNKVEKRQKLILFYILWAQTTSSDLIPTFHIF